MDFDIGFKDFEEFSSVEAVSLFPSAANKLKISF
jgi:hypothetical protein